MTPNGPALWSAILAQLPTGSVVAGGAVRDFLMGVEPKDVDVFCPALPDGRSHRPLGFTTPAEEGHLESEEYDGMTDVLDVLRGEVCGVTVDLITMDMQSLVFSGRAVVDGFDLGITRCWFDGELHDTPEAAADREAGTVTLHLNDRLERSQARFSRFNKRHGGRFRFVTPVPSEEEVVF